MRIRKRHGRRRDWREPRAAAAGGDPGEESPLMTAMQDEMKRSMADLRLKGEPAP